MKKAILILLCFAMLVVAVSCNTDDNGEIDTSQSESSSSSEETYTNSSIETTTDILPDTLKESPIEDFEYKENEDGGITITRYVGNDENVVIPSVIKGKPVTKIGTYAMAGPIVVSVVIPDSVTEIESSAFYNSKSLTTVKLSKKLSVIWDEAFMDCSSLNDIVLPDSLTRITAHAFANCTSLKHINIPSNVFSEASGYAFCNSGLETVDLEDQVILPHRVFAYTKLKEITIPDTVRTIDSYAFSNCSELVTVKLNDGLQTIGYEAFSNSKIKEIIIPKTVENVTEMSFAYCTDLKKVKFEGNAPETFIDLPLSTLERPNEFNYVVYYHNSAIGFTSPEWYGYSTEIW